MNRIKPKRRWWQFSLRSVLLLTLAVALWLGYEVRQARQVERTVAAIRDLGGDAECEPTGWSLLRLCGVPGYGQRIVRTEILGATAGEAIDLLRGVSSLREVEVAYDGTFDPTPSWRQLREAFPTARIDPRAMEDEPMTTAMEDEILSKGWSESWNASRKVRRFARMRARIGEAYPNAIRLRSLLDSRQRAWLEDVLFNCLEYRLIVLSDGTLAELLISNEEPRSTIPSTRRRSCLVTLVIANKCVGVRGSLAEHGFPRVVVEDFDRDGSVDVGLWSGAIDLRGPFQFSGDQRIWLGVYQIERDGFKSLLPEDKSDFP